MSEQACRAIIYARSQGRCELCGRPGESVHHRNKQGRVWSPSNTLHLCGDGVLRCHGWIEAHPDMARLLGLWVPRNMDPTVYPVWMQPTGWPRQFWQLDDDGMLHFVHHPHPDPDAAGRAQQAFSDARGLGLVVPPGLCV